MSRSCICVVCGEESEHYAKSMCQKCYRHNSYTNNQAVELARANKYYTEHIDERNVYSRRYTADHNKENSVRNKEWAHNNPRGRFLGHKYRLKTHMSAPPGYVWHHTCYDHKDPEANIVLLSRSSHAMGHKLLRMLDVVIPCVNMESN